MQNDITKYIYHYSLISSAVASEYTYRLERISILSFGSLEIVMSTESLPFGWLMVMHPYLWYYCPFSLNESRF